MPLSSERVVATGRSARKGLGCTRRTMRASDAGLPMLQPPCGPRVRLSIHGVSGVAAWIPANAGKNRRWPDSAWSAVIRFLPRAAERANGARRRSGRRAPDRHRIASCQNVLTRTSRGTEGRSLGTNSCRRKRIAGHRHAASTRSRVRGVAVFRASADDSPMLGPRRRPGMPRQSPRGTARAR